MMPMTRIALDAGALQVLAHQGLDPDSVPAAGRVVVLKDNANLSTGGTAEDVTDRIHPANAAACVRAARKIGLDVAGIDVVCEDLGVPLKDQGGAIIEVNAAPGIRMHHFPSIGEGRDVGAAIVDALFPPGGSAPEGRVPVIAVTGTNGKTTTALLMAHAFRTAGLVTGVTTTEAIYVDGEAIDTGDCTGFWSARTVLNDPDVEAVVLEVARGGIFKRGLGFDVSDVGVVLNVQDDHLGQHGAATLADLAAVKGLIARTARTACVLNAEDPLVVAMAADVRPGCEVILFALDPRCPAMERHLDAGGRGVYAGRGQVVLARGDHREPLVAIADLPFTLGGAAKHNVKNALAAAAALWAQGVAEATIAEALRTFTSDAAQNPGRLNVYPMAGFTAIADYAHNADGLRAILETARALPHRRLIGVIAAPGDRQDDKLREMGRIAGAPDGFDAVVVRERHELRGRALGDVSRLLAEGLREAGLADDAIRALPDAHDAVEAALAWAEPGDLVVVCCADTPAIRDQLAGHAATPDTRLTITMMDEFEEAPSAVWEGETNR